jgi:hypothetical protein
MNDVGDVVLGGSRPGDPRLDDVDQPVDPVRRSGDEAAARVWLLEQVLDEGPPVRISDPAVDGRPPGPAPVDLDADADAAAVPNRDVNAGARRVLRVLLAGVGLAAAVIVTLFAVVGGGPAAAPPQEHPDGAAPELATPAPSTIPVPQQDQAVPYTPTTDSCPAGSSSPLALTDTGADSAWVCVRGPQESRLDGQVLHVRFDCGRSRPAASCSYILGAVALTPGWVATTAGGTDPWSAHRVITRVQFTFFNGAQLAADPFMLDTNGIHGPVSAPLPAAVLASRADVLILHTARPEAAAAPTLTDRDTPPPDWWAPAPEPTQDAAPTPGPGSDPEPGGDPVDATFAMSRLSFYGHSPR